MIQGLVLVEGENVIDKNLFIVAPVTDHVVVPFDGFGHIVQFSANANADFDAAVRGLAAVPNVTGVTTLALRLTD
jgi:hypothetical protein